jgi:hypothetical protein
MQLDASTETRRRAPAFSAFPIVATLLGIGALAAPLGDAEQPVTRAGVLLAFGGALEILHGIRRADARSWRQYEMAGISHLPEPILDLDVPNQNPADARPIFRAAFDNLARWIRGVPPPARYFQGGVDASNVFGPVLDADGNWAGGLRLPHLSSRVRGRRAGAPLGTYDPINEAGRAPFNPFALISGTFTRFSDAEILARFPTRQTYVRGVVLAAASLAQKRYITDDDAAALVAAARNEPLPFVTPRN